MTPIIDQIGDIEVGHGFKHILEAIAKARHMTKAERNLSV